MILSGNRRYDWTIMKIRRRILSGNVRFLVLVEFKELSQLKVVRVKRKREFVYFVQINGLLQTDYESENISWNYT